MGSLIDFLKILYSRNKLLAIVTVLVMVVIFAGCSAQGGAPPPSGPIGGGCG